MGNTVITFQDVFKQSFLKGASTGNLSYMDMGFNLLLTFFLGLFIFFIYRKTFQGILYTLSFNISLIMLALVTSVIIMTVTSNIVLSLGMVGALSIVRFRTAVKDTIDIVFMFWAISMGIATGAGFYELAVLSSLFIGIILMIMTLVSKQRTFASGPYLIILHFAGEVKEKDLIDEVSRSTKALKLKSKSVTRDGVELTCEVRLIKGETSFMDSLSEKPGMLSAVLMSYNGDFAG